jgi:hypothetical protein
LEDHNAVVVGQHNATKLRIRSSEIHHQLANRGVGEEIVAKLWGDGEPGVRVVEG